MKVGGWQIHGGPWLCRESQHRETQQQQEQKQHVMNNGIKNGMFTFILIQVVFLLIFYVKTRMLGDLTNIFFNGS